MTTEVIENCVMCIPFTFLYFVVQRHKGKVLSHSKIIVKSIQIAFLFSFTIEMLQLLLRLGTWQLSDLFFNTVGGFVDGLFFYYVLSYCYSINRIDSRFLLA